MSHASSTGPGELMGDLVQPPPVSSHRDSEKSLAAWVLSDQVPKDSFSSSPMCQKSVYALQRGGKLSLGSVEPVDVDSRVSGTAGAKNPRKGTKTKAGEIVAGNEK